MTHRVQCGLIENRRTARTDHPHMAGSTILIFESHFGRPFDGHDLCSTWIVHGTFHCGTDRILERDGHACQGLRRRPGRMDGWRRGCRRCRCGFLHRLRHGFGCLEVFYRRRRIGMMVRYRFGMMHPVMNLGMLPGRLGGWFGYMGCRRLQACQCHRERNRRRCWYVRFTLRNEAQRRDGEQAFDQQRNGEGLRDGKFTWPTRMVPVTRHCWLHPRDAQQSRYASCPPRGRRPEPATSFVRWRFSHPRW